MIIADLAVDDLARRMAGPGLTLRSGPFRLNVRSRLGNVVEGVRGCYALHPVQDDHCFTDFYVNVSSGPSYRRLLSPLAIFEFDGVRPFTPLPAGQGFPLLEWGLNWCVYNHCHQYLIAHSAVLERDGMAVVMPASSGSGKSTLCAALAFRGWRLLSDELALFNPDDATLQPLVRPISLKNRSVDVIADFAPAAVIGSTVRDTMKGTVCHFRPPEDALQRADCPAKPRWIVFPKFEPQAAASLRPVRPGAAFAGVMQHCFNYSQHGHAGFDLLARIVDGCDAYEFAYSRLDDAIDVFEQLYLQA